MWLLTAAIFKKYFEHEQAHTVFLLNILHREKGKSPVANISAEN